MRVSKTAIVILLTLSLASCMGNQSAISPDTAKAQIIQTELDFARMADETGIAGAFYEFADDSAVINRGGTLIKGKNAIRDYYESRLKPGTKLEWAPDFVDVSGDLGYTYGRFTHSVADSTGNMIETQGFFHTVWKRQADGTWRYVWD